MKHNTNTAEQPLPGWRFQVGILFFVLGFLCPLGIPLVTALSLSTSWKATLSGLFMLGIPELLWLVAAAIMGKPGFNHLKAKVFGTLKRYALPVKVSRTRYRIGLVMFAIPLLIAWVDPYAAHLVPDYGNYRTSLAIAGDVLLIASLFVLGGEYWDKLRSLFIYEAKPYS